MTWNFDPNVNNPNMTLAGSFEQIMQNLGDSVTYIANPFFKQCNNMGSLWFAKDFIGDTPFVHLHGDIIYTKKLFSTALKHFVTHKTVKTVYFPGNFRVCGLQQIVEHL